MKTDPLLERAHRAGPGLCAQTLRIAMNEVRNVSNGARAVCRVLRFLHGSLIPRSFSKSETVSRPGFELVFVNASNPKMVDALRALRRFVMAFRSHSKGQLARVKEKLEHQRMIKNGIGRSVLDGLIKDGIIYTEDHMYVLDPNILGQKVGASYMAVKLKEYSGDTHKYLENLIS